MPDVSFKIADMEFADDHIRFLGMDKGQGATIHIDLLVNHKVRFTIEAMESYKFYRMSNSPWFISDALHKHILLCPVGVLVPTNTASPTGNDMPVQIKKTACHKCKKESNFITVKIDLRTYTFCDICFSNIVDKLPHLGKLRGCQNCLKGVMPTHQYTIITNAQISSQIYLCDGCWATLRACIYNRG